MAQDLTAQTVDLLQTMIRNECVNDGTPDSGQEHRNADVLHSYLEVGGLDVETYEPHLGRKSLVARIEGSDPDAPTVCLMGHTDVVPVDPSGWREDPFGGELIDGEVWGRGAVDMLNLTASMAVATRHLASTGWRPRGTLIFLGVADEEAMGTHGAGWMVDHVWDDIACDYVLTENGGYNHVGPDGRRKVVFQVAEKGLAWRRLTIKGTPGHGSAPYRADNALVTAAEVVRRIAEHRSRPDVNDLFRAQVDAAELPEDLKADLLDPARLDDALARLPRRAAPMLHACTHTTFSPNVARAGKKHNVIPSLVTVDVDIRTLPGVSGDDVDRELGEVLGDLADRVEISRMIDDSSTASPRETPMWDALERHVRSVHPDADLVPSLMIGGTDARFFRHKGAVGYGAALLAPDLTAADFGSRFHGHNERIDIESLARCTDLWLGVVQDVLG